MSFATEPVEVAADTNSRPDWTKAKNTGTVAQPPTGMSGGLGTYPMGSEETMLRTSALPGKDDDYTKNACAKVCSKGKKMKRQAFKWASDIMAEEQRKQELHEQKMRHAEELHQVKLETVQTQAAQKVAPTVQSSELTPEQAQQQQQYTQNLIPQPTQFNPLAKRAEVYYTSPDEAARTYPNVATPVGVGAAGGAAAAHFLVPTEETVKHRKAVEALQNILKPGDTKALEEIRRLKTLAYATNAKRLLKGTAAGAGAGLLAHILFNNPNA
jgi:hypothetical protein